MTFPLELSYEEALADLQRAVAERGEDYVYEREGGSCVYFWTQTGTPSCIVGHVLSYHGLQATDLDENAAGSTVAGLVDRGYLSLTERARALLNEAQLHQDGGAPWGVALAKAIEEAQAVQ